MATNFFWDDLEDNVIEEYDDAGVTIADYTTEPDHFGSVISQYRDGQSSFFHYDGQGSTLAVTDENQNITDTFAYTAFGEITERTGTTEIPFQYIGQKGYYRDVLTGVYWVRTRPYEPSRARWLTADPIGPIMLGSNIYIYTDNSPARHIDPSGLFIWTWCGEWIAERNRETHAPCKCYRRSPPLTVSAWTRVTPLAIAPGGVCLHALGNCHYTQTWKSNYRCIGTCFTPATAAPGVASNTYSIDVCISTPPGAACPPAPAGGWAAIMAGANIPPPLLPTATVEVLDSTGAIIANQSPTQFAAGLPPVVTCPYGSVPPVC